MDMDIDSRDDLLKGPAEDRFLPPDALNGQGQPYRALYLHIPFCQSRCAYCDFVTDALPCSDPRIDEYVDQLVLAIRHAGKRGLLGSIETVYLGGGTPSYIGMKRLSKILYTLSVTMHLTPEVECSMEANPESLTAAMVKDLWALGVNRLSIGVQSLNDDTLKTLSRIHTADKARQAIAIARERFDNVSVDMMCGIPGQDPEDYCRELEEVVSLGANHVSVYPLTIEPGTPFDRMIEQGTLEEMPQDDEAMMMQMAASVLEPLGLARYEVASYARPGFACKHNESYWTGKPYLGLGDSAATMMQTDRRRVRVQDGQVQDDLDQHQMVCEDLMLGMRMTQGVSDEQVRAAGLHLPKVQATFFALEQRHLVEHVDGRWQPTLGGWLLGNELFGAIYALAPGTGA
ncbi:MAG: radical SAM family heme chaperone HemW [Eggerthellaceae bacterium]|jgi:oxygen-independent coproporphyrinogen-3 oxidase